MAISKKTAFSEVTISPEIEEESIESLAEETQRQSPLTESGRDSEMLEELFDHANLTLSGLSTHYNHLASSAANLIMFNGALVTALLATVELSSIDVTLLLGIAFLPFLASIGMALAALNHPKFPVGINGETIREAIKLENAVTKDEYIEWMTTRGQADWVDTAETLIEDRKQWIRGSQILFLAGIALSLTYIFMSL